MYKCKTPDCNNEALKKGWFCKSCYNKEKSEEKGLFDVLHESARRAKKEHVIFIAYIAGLVGMLLAYGYFIDKANGASPWYGGFFTLGLILSVILPGYLIWCQLKNERKMIEAQKKVWLSKNR